MALRMLMSEASRRMSSHQTFTIGSFSTPFIVDNGTTVTSLIADNLTSMFSDDMPPEDSLQNLSVTCLFNTSLNTSTCENGPSNTSNVDSYDLPHALWLTIILGFLASVISVVTVVGNITVLLAFGLERTIRQPTNYFLASLAVSDLLIGTFSMPLYTQYLLWGSWALGPWLCDLWLSLDWTVCLTSQYTVFLITMDRFLSVKIPAKYRNWRTEKKVLVMISITWILPAMVFFTSIIGWQYFVGKRTVKPENCEVQFMEDTMFTFLLTIGYYWITLVVMCILYGGIYKVALDLQRKSDAKHKKMQSTMELAGENPSPAMRSIGGDGEKCSINSSGCVDSVNPPQAQNNNKNSKLNNRKSVKTSLPCPPGIQNINTTSFSTGKDVDKDDERSSSPAFGSDDENSSSGGAAGSSKGPLNSSLYSSKVGQAGGIINSVLFSNTGGLVRSLHGELFLSTSTESQNLLQPPPPYSKHDTRLTNETGSDVEGRDHQEFDSLYSSSASDRLEKQTVPLLQNEINKGCRFIDEKSLLATLSSENAALLPVITGDSEFEDSDVADLHTSSPIWKRRTSLPPLASDVFDIDDEVSDYLIAADLTTTTDMPTSSPTLLSSCNRCGLEDQRPRADTVNTLTSSITAADTGTDDSSGNKSSQSNVTGNAASYPSGSICIHSPPSETNTNEDSSRCESHCLASIRRRRNKDTRLHSFVKSVRSRNSRRRNRRERKSKSENRARKALRTISFILGAFVLCWTPYHIAIMVFALCMDCVNLSLYAFTYWMCYLNSPINPFCYAFANAQFKRTFLRIMRFDWHRT
ncbi:unnamed protein product [Candidula unifasciata]|uniref:G-protein coupled receptors family 1 profile domain-containing protein n=1 Tax=Candidula unifasciata TaxID=100452 RepID=A0A8S3Z662_9EUPU|nr:unnamed protein product [Candidula unifasciata]